MLHVLFLKQKWIPNKLLVIVNEAVAFKKDKYRASFQHLKLYNIKT